MSNEKAKRKLSWEECLKKKVRNTGENSTFRASLLFHLVWELNPVKTYEFLPVWVGSKIIATVSIILINSLLECEKILGL